MRVSPFQLSAPYAAKAPRSRGRATASRMTRGKRARPPLLAPPDAAKRRSGAHSSTCTAAIRAAPRWTPDLHAARSVRGSEEETDATRSEEHKTELQSLMRTQYAGFC